MGCAVSGNGDVGRGFIFNTLVFTRDIKGGAYNRIKMINN